MCFPSIPVLRCSAHLSAGLPPCFGPLLFYCAPPGCFWAVSLFLPSGVHVRAVTQSLSGCCLRMCPINRHLVLLTSSLNLSTLASSSCLSITNLILPFNLHYPSQASVLKHIDFLSITFVHFPCFATTHEKWFDQGFL